MNILSPSMLSIDFGNIERDLKEMYQAGADTLHFDIMDGMFVPNISFGQPVFRAVRKILPDVKLDVHMMVQEPTRYLDDFASAGADIMTIHYEATSDVEKAIKDIKSAGIKVGLALKPATSAEVLLPYLDELDMVLIMSVEPGFGGQAFRPESLDKIRQTRQYIRQRGLNTDIEIDGGVTANNLADILDAGANVIVTGSSIFNGNITENVKRFLEIMK